MKIVKIIALVLLIAFVGIQFVPTKRNQGELVPATDFLEIYSPPEKMESILRSSCYDCHSNNTAYPWYNNVQPIRWYLEDHIKHGKEELNLSEFGDYSDRRKSSKLTAMISQVEEGEMPLDSYTWIHWGAKLSKEEKTNFIAYLAKIKDSI